MKIDVEKLVELIQRLLPCVILAKELIDEAKSDDDKVDLMEGINIARQVIACVWGEK